MEANTARRLYFIVNPIAGSGRADRCFKALKQLLEAADADFGFCYTKAPKDGVKLTLSALEAGEKAVVAVGGDGTVRECASAYNEYCESHALTGDERPIFGLFPVGTGNDFARPLGISGDPEAIAGALLCDVPRYVDMGACASFDIDKPQDAINYPFVNFSGFGFDVDVVKYTEKHKKHMNGLLPYMLGVFEAMLHLKPLVITLKETGSEREEKLEALMLSVCNGTHLGGGMNAAPKSDPSDGLLDCCVLKRINLMQFICLLPKYVKGKHASSPHIRYFKAAGVRVECDKISELNFDGELSGEVGGGRVAEYTIKSGALRLIPDDMRLRGQ